MKQVSCTLQSLYDETVVISLPHNVPVVLGRIEEQKIADIGCSRRQLEVTADTDVQKVSIKQIGNGKSKVNGIVLNKDDNVNAGNGDKIEVVPDKYSFKIEFDENDASNDHSSTDINNCTSLITKSNHDDSKRSLLQTPTAAKNSSVNLFLKQSLLPKLGDWEDVEKGKLIIFTSYGIQHKEKIAGYDLDGTLITTKSGNVYPKDRFDWKIIYPEVITKLKDLNDFKITLFTNQGGIANGKTKSSEFKWKIEQIVRSLNVPVQVFIAAGNSIYRKPLPGMWNYLIQHKNGGIAVKNELSYYCGDAAGRPVCVESKKKKKDFAASDRLLAMNVGLAFYTPEEHFLNHKPLPYILPTFNPTSITSSMTGLSITDPPNAILVDKQNIEIIVMVGCPGSGKSHFVRKYLKPEGYVHVNRDTLGSWEKCVSLVRKSIAEKQNVVVDNTNPDKVSRSRYVELAKEHGIKTRAFVMNLSREHVKHNNKFRELTDNSHVPISVAVISGCYAKYEEPSVEEGFAEIVKVNFVPSFSRSEHRELYSLYLLES